jgi:hypothetical protein
VNRDNRVLAIVLAAEHLLRLARLDGGRELVEGSPQVVGDRLPHARPFDQDVQVLEPAAQRVAQVTLLLEPAAALQNFLRTGLVLPEVGGGDALFYACEFFRGAGCVKDSSADRPRGARDPDACEAARRVERPSLLKAGSW